MIAVHNAYLQEPAYQAASGFLETVIALPHLPAPIALSETLVGRARVAIRETALAYACDDDANTIDVAHVELAITE